MQLKPILYNPLELQHKSKRGAVCANQLFEIKLKIARDYNPDSVELHITKDGETEVTYALIDKNAIDKHYYEYSLSFMVTTPGLYFYHFSVRNDYGSHFIGCDDSLSAVWGSGNRWQLSAYETQNAAPNWLKGGIMYQILPDRFFDAGERLATKTGREEVIYRSDWGNLPEYRATEDGKILNNDFFGGNIKGIIKKLGYLKSLGVTALYLNPIFEAYSNHKYDTGNYMRIDSDFGTEEDFANLIKRAEKRGIKIILDGVFNHTGDNSIYFNKYGRYDSVGAYQSKNSPYSDWYLFEQFPDKYISWWGIDTIPHTNKNSINFSEFIAGVEGVIAKWQKMGVSGWRLDVVDELPDKFLDKIAHRVKSIDSNALLIGEVWEDASNKISYDKRRRYFSGKQLDSVSNYPFKDDIINFVTSGNSWQLANTVGRIINNYPKDVLDNLMNILGTHDTARILTTLGDTNGAIETREDRAKATVKDLEKATQKVKLAATLLYTLPGIPCVYYGDEIGLQGFEDPFNRRCYPWETDTKKLEKPQKKLLSFYRALGKIRAANTDVLATGDFNLIETNDNTFVFSRKSGNKNIIIIANANDKPLEYAVAGGYTNLITKKPYTGAVPAYSAVVLRK